MKRFLIRVLKMLSALSFMVVFITVMLVLGDYVKAFIQTAFSEDVYNIVTTLFAALVALFWAFHITKEKKKPNPIKPLEWKDISDAKFAEFSAECPLGTIYLYVVGPYGVCVNDEDECRSFFKYPSITGDELGFDTFEEAKAEVERQYQAHMAKALKD